MWTMFPIFLITELQLRVIVPQFYQSAAFNKNIEWRSLTDLTISPNNSISNWLLVYLAGFLFNVFPGAVPDILLLAIGTSIQLIVCDGSCRMTIKGAGQYWTVTPAL